jgi:calcium-dependent protein kinase
VRRCISRVTSTVRAVKVINKKHLHNADSLKRFLYEIEVLKDLDHPNVLKVFEYFLDDDRLYIVTEFVEGRELLQEVNRKKGTKEVCFEEEEAALLIKQVLTVLNYCHKKNIVHRDVKLENIMIESMPTVQDPEAPW